MRFTTIGIRVMANKMTILTKFEVEKFDGKSNFLLWKMQVMSVLVKEATYTRSCLLLRRNYQRKRMMSETTSIFAQKR